MRLIITRHGETEDNKIEVMQGHLPGKLSKKGILQAKKVALRLKDEKIDIIFSSDLARASDTAKIIAKFHPNAKFKLTKELRERDLGEMQGKKESEFSEDAKGIESFKKIYKRAEKFIHKIIPKYSKLNIFLVSHGGFNKNLIAVIMGKSNEEVKSIEKQHNTSVNIFEIDEDKNHKIHAFNCIKHLE